MKDVARLVLCLRAAKLSTAAAIALALATVVTGTGLLGIATYLISYSALKPPLIELAAALALVRLFGISRGFVRYGERVVSHDTTLKLLQRLRMHLYTRLAALAPGQLLELRSADLLTRLVRDVEDSQTVFQYLAAPVVVAALTVVGLGCVLWSLAPMVVLPATLALLTAGVVLPGAALVCSSGAQTTLVRLRAEVELHVADTLQGLVDVLAFGNGDARLQTIANSSRSMANCQTRLATIAALRVGLNDIVVRCGAWGLLFVCGWLLTRQQLSPVLIAVPAILLLGAADTLEPLAQAAQRLAGTRAAAGRMWSIVDRAPALEFPVDTALVHGDALEFRNVSFGYSDGPVLRNINLTLRRGTATGIVGPSGAGKSTLLLLAARACDPTAGEVLLDGCDLRTLSAKSVATRIGLLAQHSMIFSATLRYNLQLGRPHATDAEICEMLREVGLEHLVAALPQGPETWLGDEGVRLSGGERQRLALARQLLAGTPFLLLDEPTANLDTESERIIMDVLRARRRTHGILVVSHRLPELDWVDELVVLEQGKIVRRGRSQNLLSSHPVWVTALSTSARS